MDPTIENNADGTSPPDDQRPSVGDVNAGWRWYASHQYAETTARKFTFPTAVGRSSRGSE
jgi:hypothetical protein